MGSVVSIFFTVACCEVEDQVRGATRRADSSRCEARCDETSDYYTH